MVEYMSFHRRGGGRGKGRNGGKQVFHHGHLRGYSMWREGREGGKAGRRIRIQNRTTCTSNVKKVFFELLSLLYNYICFFHFSLSLFTVYVIFWGAGGGVVVPRVA